jgi:hypothetical protein
LNVWEEKLPDFDQDAVGAKYKGVWKSTPITMFEIEKLAQGNATVLRLVGRINAEQLCTSIQRVLHNSQLLFIPLEWLRKAAHPFDCGSPNVLRP